MNIDVFFEWFEEYCRKRHYGVSPQTILQEADRRGLDLGHISQVGRKHLMPRGWTRPLTKSGKSLYLPPKRKLCDKGNRIITISWCLPCDKNNIQRRYCDQANREIEKRVMETGAFRKGEQ